MFSNTPDEFPLLSGVAPHISQSLDSESESISLSEAAATGTKYLQHPTPGNVVYAVSKALNDYAGNGTADDEDRIFWEHGLLVQSRIRVGDLRQVASIWETTIEPLVNAREKALGKHIHKGAPLYNTGIALFVSGDFDRALAYFVEAGCHDEGLGRGSPIKIPVGDHPLSQQIMIDPLGSLLKLVWGADYAAVTGLPLDGRELTRLLLCLADRPSDAIQAVVALHRIARTQNGPQNHGTCVVRFRAFAELLHLIESFLRHFQKTPDGKAVHGQLNAHLDHLLSANSIVRSARESFKIRWKQWYESEGYDYRSTEALNWLFVETGKGIRSATSAAVAAGVVTVFCHKFRNSLLHVNEEKLSIFQNMNECVTATGWVLGMLRVCARAKEGMFSPPDFT